MDSQVKKVLDVIDRKITECEDKFKRIQESSADLMGKDWEKENFLFANFETRIAEGMFNGLRIIEDQKKWLLIRESIIKNFG